MGMHRGTLARVDRKLLASLGDDEAYRTVRVPANAAKWSTWKRHCDAAGLSMGRAVAMLIHRELLSVSGEQTAGELLVLVEQATEELAIREAEIAAREHDVDTVETRLREQGERLRRREAGLEAREQQAELVSKLVSRRSTARTKIGRNERCPCGSGLKYKRCHGRAGRRSRAGYGWEPTTDRPTS